MTILRRPLTDAEAYAWHVAALAGRNPPIFEMEPEAGWFETRLVKNGPFVPAIIWLDQEIDPATGELEAPAVWRAQVDGEPTDAAKIWLRVARRPVPEWKWRGASEERDWLRQNDPRNPLLNARQPMRLADLAGRL